MNPVFAPNLPEDLSNDRRGRRIGRWIFAGALVLIVGVALIGRFRPSVASEAPPTPQAALSDTLARPPAGVRIRVRVLNITTTRGLAKRATTHLRAYGYDVVDYDSDIKPAGTPSRILSHTGKDDWAQRLRRAVGTGAIEFARDSLRYVDFTVLIGSDWKPTPQAFRP